MANVQSLFVDECSTKKDSKDDNDDGVQFAYAYDTDSDGVLLMATTKLENDKSKMYYLDLGCSWSRTKGHK